MSVLYTMTGKCQAIAIDNCAQKNTQGHIWQADTSFTMQTNTGFCRILGAYDKSLWKNKAHVCLFLLCNIKQDGRRILLGSCVIVTLSIPSLWKKAIGQFHSHLEHVSCPISLLFWKDRHHKIIPDLCAKVFFGKHTCMPIHANYSNLTYTNLIILLYSPNDICRFHIFGIGQMI